MFRPIRLNACNPGPFTGEGNNTYFLAGEGGGAMLIDAGVGDSRHLAAIDRELRDRHSRLEHVVVTHAHPDHASGAPALASAYENVSVAKYPWPERDRSYDVEWRALDDGEQLVVGGETLVALHTPGHSPDHIALWHDRTRTAFTGDLVVQGSSVAISWSGGGRVDHYLRSLERVMALRPERLLPAHGAEIGDPRAILHGTIGHRRLRERQIVEALAAGRDTVPSIAESIYHGLGPSLMPPARETVRAHLEKLKSEGRAFEESGRWWM
jgi:glyoxylase-like metal-dependent hydrolase (beta-lactamase superfamily II)